MNSSVFGAPRDSASGLCRWLCESATVVSGIVSGIDRAGDGACCAASSMSSSRPCEYWLVHTRMSGHETGWSYGIFSKIFLHLRFVRISALLADVLGALGRGYEASFTAGALRVGDYV